MNHRLFLPLAISVLVLAGCYRQASDSFEQVDSQNVQSIESPTALPITPTLDETAIEAMSGDETDQPSTVPSKTPDPNDPDPTDDIPATSTIIVRNTAQPPLVPTATNPVFRTPEPPPGQVVQPTINPPTATPTFDIIPPTPTDVADGVQATDECVHEVVSGDNLFRIAINNGTTVEAIMQLNTLENDAIQIEQLLRIPGCVPGQADDDDDSTTTTVTRPTATSSVGGSSVATVEPADNIPSAGEQIHVVASGETLGGIARRYGLTIADIVEANNLTNPNALSIGQELLIPAGS